MKLLAPAILSMLLCAPLAASEQAPWDDPSCQFEKIDLELLPDALLERFLERDGAGRFLGSDRWMDKAVICPGHLAGPDAFSVISSYRIVKSSPGKARAAFTVRYEVIGTISSAGPNGELTSFTPEPKPREVEFVAVKTPHGWKLQDFAWQMVLAGPAQAWGAKKAWVPGDQEKLQKAAGNR